MKIIKELYRLLKKSYAATNAMLLIVQTSGTDDETRKTQLKKIIVVVCAMMSVFPTLLNTQKTNHLLRSFWKFGKFLIMGNFFRYGHTHRYSLSSPVRILQ